MEKAKIEAKIIKRGNSSGVTIPPAILKALGLKVGDKIQAEIKKA